MSFRSFQRRVRQWGRSPEAVNNAARHSGCTRAEMDVRVVGSRICLSVSDDGRGFDPALASEGNGLHSMHNRAAALGGQLTIESGAGNGVRLQLHVPLAPGSAGIPG